MVLGKTTYDALPYLYLGASVSSVMFLDSRIKYLPALILLCAALLVLIWRKGEARRLEKARIYSQSRRKSNAQNGYSVTHDWMS